MPETHRFIIDRHEGDLAVVEVDGGSLLDFPRWLLPHAARADDVLRVTVDAGPGRGPEAVTAPVAYLDKTAQVGLVCSDPARPQQPIPQGGETPNDVLHSSRARGGRRGRRGGDGPSDRPTDRSTATAGDRGRRRLWPVPVPAQGQFGRRGPEPVLDPTRLHQRGRQVLGRPPNARDG